MPEACQKCRTIGEQCVYPSVATSEYVCAPGRFTSNESITQAGLKRRRIIRSCLECKNAKVRCYGGHICERCIKKKLHCSLAQSGLHTRAESSQEAIINSTLHTLQWLLDEHLPPFDQLKQLVDIYFCHIHPVRCMGFLHIPTFMQRLQNSSHLLNSDEDGLIYAICALAAPFYYAKMMDLPSENLTNPTVRFYEVGKGWASTAMRRIFLNFGRLGIEGLMTAILLQDYYLRIGEYDQAFLISGIVSRHMQMLQLNIEHANDATCQKNTSMSFADKESRRRVAWACYLLDAFIECGVNQLRFVSSDTLQIQLPCAENLFMRSTPCVTEMLPPGKLSSFTLSSVNGVAADNLDLRAFYIRTMAIRSKILAYVKHLDGEIPWESSRRCQFDILNRDLVDLETSIPSSMQISPENTYLFKSCGRLNLYFGLHILLSQTFCDLYRIGVSQLVYHDSAAKWIRNNAPDSFIYLCHHVCVSKAVYVASLLKDLWDCHKLSLVDIPYVVHTQICSSVIVTTLLSWPHQKPIIPQYSNRDYQQLLKSNVMILRYLQQYFKADIFTESSKQALKRFNRTFFPDASAPSVSRSAQAENPPRQYSLEYILSPLRTYPFTCKQIAHRHKGNASGGYNATQTALDLWGSSTKVSRSNPHLSSVNISTPSGATQEKRNGSFNAEDARLVPTLGCSSEMPLMEGLWYPTFLEEGPDRDNEVTIKA